MAFEPVVDGRSRKAAFYECLVRMEQEDGQVLLAPDIVPVAERLGLIRLVDHRVLELAVAELVASPNVSSASTSRRTPRWIRTGGPRSNP